MERSDPSLIHGDQSGFTLLETLIALTIMVISLASIITVESNSISASTRTRQMNIVAMLARNKMVEMEYKVEGKKFEEVKEEEGGNFEAPYQGYRWNTAIKEIKFPSFGGGGGSEGAGGGSSGQGNTDVVALVGRLVSNFLSKACREINVTVTWKRGSGEQNFTVSTYWVDLNHEFQLSE